MELFLNEKRKIKHFVAKLFRATGRFEICLIEISRNLVDFKVGIFFEFMPLWNCLTSAESLSDVFKFPSVKNFRRDKDHTVYLIEVYVESYHWTVERRYSDFLEFDKKRFKHLKQSFLPGKKLLRSHDVDFVKKRLTELDQYLKTVFELEILLQKKRGRPGLPRALAEFLDFNKYEVRGICENLAEEYSSNGGHASSCLCEYYEFSPLHLHAITERLKLPEPTCVDDDARLDFGHVLDFTTRLHNLKIKGSNAKFGSSSIIPNELEFCLGCFKSLKSLWIADCSANLIRDLQYCRQTVVHLTVHRSLSSLSDIIVDKDFYLNDETTCTNSASQLWKNVKAVDFSFNEISRIDKSVIFLRPVETLNLTSNRLTSIDHLQHLTSLTELDLSHNAIEHIVDWHKKLGNVKRLKLTANKLGSIEGLRRLFSLECLDLRFNRLVQTVDVRPLAQLPMLEALQLAGNPLDASVEFRSRALEEAFGDRVGVGGVRLDDQPTSQRELDAVGVRLAIRRAKEERERRLSACRESMVRALDFGLGSLNR